MAKHIDPILAKDQINKLREANKDSFHKAFLFSHVPANEFLQQHPSVMVLCTPDNESTGPLPYTDFRVGIFGVMNGLIGIHGGDDEKGYSVGKYYVTATDDRKNVLIRLRDENDVDDRKWSVVDADAEKVGSGWSYLAAEVDEDGVLHRFVFTPNCLISEAEPEDGQEPKIRPEPPVKLAPDFALEYMNSLLAGDSTAISALTLQEFTSEDKSFGTNGKWGLLDVINSLVDIGNEKWGKIVAKVSGKTVTGFEIKAA